MCTINRTGGRLFGPEGCQVPIGKGICGETRTLDIINEFKRLYEEKMKEIDNNGGGDSLQEKIKLQQDWIGDLTDQNEMLVRAVEELEVEATERVHMLEEKLQQSAKCIGEVMKRYRENDMTNDLLKEPQEKIFHLENDKKNLLEFIRRIRVENEWSMGGLTFFQITHRDLFGDENGEDFWKEKCDRYLICDNEKEEKKIKDRECTIRELHLKLGDVNELSKELQTKKQECDALQKNLIDVRQALTEEVASKHDTILKLKKDYQELEDRCIQADKQTAFRDDIIKELRKEIKQLKQQENDKLREKEIKLLMKLATLENESELLKYSGSLISSPVNVNMSKLSDEVPKQNLYSFMENEIIQLNNIIEINRKQLKEQLDLIKIMVKKLFKFDIGLEFIEERVKSVNCDCLEKTRIELHAKNLDLDKKNTTLELNVKEYKSQIRDLEQQFKEFLKDKTQLKEKYVTVKIQCKCVLEESVKLKSENDALKIKAENLQSVYEHQINDKISLEDEIKQLKEDLNNFVCNKENDSCQIEKLSKENKKLMSDLCKLNEENRNLLKNLDDQKTQNSLTTTVTCDEIGKLNSTIEELHNTLQKTKRVQEDEDKKKANTIDTLNNRLIELESSLKEAEEKVRVCKICRGRSRVGFADTSEVQTDQTVVYSDAVAMLQDRDEMILSQSETLNMFQHELQTLKNKESELRRETENYHKETEYLKNTINELEKATNNDTVIDDRGLEKLMESIQNRDEIIKNQNETLILIQQELELSKKQDSDMNSEREKYCCNIELLKQRIEELESSLKYAEGRADNLQTAVNLYVNSLNVMEATEEKYKIEIDQQRATIINLQSVLVSTKQELDYLRHKSEENSMDEQKRVSRYISLMTASRIENENLQTLCGDLLVEYKKLEELNLTVEIEYCNNLQDVDELDYQLFKYQYEIKLNEEENGQYKNSLKKLMKQKKCYEEIIVYFKHEMGLMSEQLQNLQDLLNLSNESAQEEHSKLAQAFMNVQTLNQQLSTQLTAAEQKVLLENQMNQLHEVKICELERLVSEKEVDLSRHDQAILDIRQTLQDSLKQNEDSHRTILSLNETIVKLQHAVNKYETDNCMSRESNENCQLQIDSCKEKLVELKDALERKTSELCKLEMAYNNQNRTLQSAQIEMKEMKERQKSKQCHMKCIIEELKDKLSQYEGKHKGLLEELKQLQTQLGIVTRKDAVKEVEIKRYRKIIGDLKRTLIELNRSLSRKNVKFESRCNNEECRKYMAQSEELRDQQETPPTCPCEVEFYQSIVETLKKSVIDLKKKLAETQKKNQELEEDQKFKESQFADISKSQMECNILKQKLMERLKQAQAEETRYSEMANQFERELASLRQELEVKTIQLDECKKSAQEINSCRCVQLACAEEEASALKEELNNLLRKHCALNVENEKLHSQSARMQSTVVSLEEKSQLLKGQVEQYLLELQMVQNEKEGLLEKNRDLLNELRSLQSSYHSAGKQQRYNSEAVKILELELNEIKNNRDEICFESKNVINYFRNWLQEQRKINQHVIAKERDFRETIETLKQENEELRFQLHPQVQRQCVRNTSCIRSATPPPACQSPWSLGSQGTASVHEESPSRSPCLNEECDWFSQSFRNESEDDEEDWVTKVEDLAAQVRRTNRMWKNKMGNSDYMVTRDPKK